MSKIQDLKQSNAPGWSFSFVQVGFWMSFCISVSFAAVYLQALGYSNAMLGLILALGSVMGIVTAISLADWIDRDRRITAKKLIPWVLGLQTASVAILLLTDAQCLAVSAAFVAYIGFCTTVNNLNLKLYADADHAGFRINYGFSRGIGSLAYVLISVALGLLMERVSYRVLPVLGLILCVVQYLAFLRFTHFVSDEKKAAPFGERNSTLTAFPKNNPRYSLLLAGVVLLFFGHSIACNFLINLTRHVGGGTADMGYITAFKGLVEIPVMFLYARLFMDGMHSLALRITAAAFVLKTLASCMVFHWQSISVQR